MDAMGSILRPLLIVAFLAAPAVVIKVLSNYLDDPYLQPLNLTLEGVTAAEEGRDSEGFARIDVQVDWGRDFDGSMTQVSLQNVIARSLASQTEFFRFDFRKVQGRDIAVTFSVGPNHYGPYPPSGMVSGINSALIALRMSRGPDG